VNYLRLFFIVIFCFIAGCDEKSERREVKVKSLYLGKEYSSLEPLVYIKNLPHDEEVSWYIAVNGPSLMAKEASRSIADFRYGCMNCLDKKRLVTPIRVEYIPVGTKLKVIDEYLDFYERFPLTDSEIRMLLLKDSEGNISEMPEYAFEDSFVKSFGKSSYLAGEDKLTLNILKKYKDSRKFSVNYCPNPKTFEFQKMSKLISDFSLENDVTVTHGFAPCDKGFTMTFFSLESFLTLRYYYRELEWGLRGRWSLP
jgi:hypothetical protein